jgi:arylsulfatase A-like enzyme
MKNLISPSNALILAVSASPFAANSVYADKPATHPNVVLIMTDDQGYPNLSCLGHPILKTPNIDNIYKHSTRLANYHVDPTCAPTRGALMTGRYSDRVGTWHTIMGRNLLRKRETTMANVFENSGYRTGIFGKWHIGDAYPFRPQDRGFQHVVIHGGGGIGQTPDFWGNDYFDDVYQVDGKRVQFKGFCTDIFFNEAIKFIQKDKKDPFFVYLVTNAPHGPMYAPDKYSKRFLDMKYKGTPVGKGTANYYGMIENIDDNVGKMVNFLKKENLLDNTILIFTTDNGPVTKTGVKIYNAGRKGHKGDYHDGGHRVPFFISWPKAGIDKGIDITQLTAHIDILPTLIDLCHLKKPDVKFDGKSLAPLIENSSAAWPDRRIIVESQRIKTPEKYRKCAVMSNKWRLCTGDGKKFELSDMAEDPAQSKNVIKENPETAKSLKESYNAWWDDVAKDHNIISRISLGAPQENPTSLTAHDWFGSSVYSQSSIIKIKGKLDTDSKSQEVKGIWKVYIERDGWYDISLRRWPAECDQPITAKYLAKKPLNAQKAVLTIQGQKMEMKVPPDSKEVTFRIKLQKGDADLSAVFITDKTTVGAFYAYILYEDGKTDKNWQTREGLGLPLAIWPKDKGKDTTAAKE